VSFTCEACGGVFSEPGDDGHLERESAAFADVAEAPMAEVCDDCWRAMRAYFPTLDARLKLEGL
jgi:predicted dithiol-disulfide oxidoreductase (DUF899 family)